MTQHLTVGQPIGLEAVNSGPGDFAPDLHYSILLEASELPARRIVLVGRNHGFLVSQLGLVDL